MNTPHSQTPWKTYQSTSFTTVTSHDRDVCLMPAALGRPYEEDDEDRANAAHICLCVNAHEELKRCLEDVLGMLELLNAPGANDPIEAKVYRARKVLKTISV